MEGVVTFSPDHNTVLLFVFSLTSKTGIHHLDPADGAGIALNVPAPHGYRVPLLEGEHLVASRLGACAPRMRGKDAGFLAVLHVGHGGGAERLRGRWARRRGAIHLYGNKIFPVAEEEELSRAPYIRSLASGL